MSKAIRNRAGGFLHLDVPTLSPIALLIELDCEFAVVLAPLRRGQQVCGQQANGKLIGHRALIIGGVACHTEGL